MAKKVLLLEVSKVGDEAHIREVSRDDKHRKQVVRSKLKLADFEAGALIAATRESQPK